MTHESKPSMGDFKGKSVVVTGDSLGMGRACVERFASGGAHVLCVAIDEASTREVAQSFGEPVRGFCGDVRRATDMQSAMIEAATAFGGVDIRATAWSWIRRRTSGTTSSTSISRDCFSRQIRRAGDHAPDNITINAVGPALVDTPMLRSSADLFKRIGAVEQILDSWGRSHPIGRIGQPSEITEAVAFLAGEKARFTTGAELKVDGGLMAKIGVVLPE